MLESLTAVQLVSVIGGTLRERAQLCGTYGAPGAVVGLRVAGLVGAAAGCAIGTAIYDATSEPSSGPMTTRNPLLNSVRDSLTGGTIPGALPTPPSTGLNPRTDSLTRKVTADRLRACGP